MTKSYRFTNILVSILDFYVSATGGACVIFMAVAIRRFSDSLFTGHSTMIHMMAGHTALFTVSVLGCDSRFCWILLVHIFSCRFAIVVAYIEHVERISIAIHITHKYMCLCIESTIDIRWICWRSARQSRWCYPLVIGRIVWNRTASNERTASSNRMERVRVCVWWWTMCPIATII